LGALDVVRDVAIILLAVESLVIGVVLVLMLTQLRALIKMLREEVEPLLNSAGQTAKRVQGTVGVVTDTVVKPLIQVRSWAAGARQVLNTLLYFRARRMPDDERIELGATHTDNVTESPAGASDGSTNAQQV